MLHSTMVHQVIKLYLMPLPTFWLNKGRSGHLGHTRGVKFEPHADFIQNIRIHLQYVLFQGLLIHS